MAAPFASISAHKKFIFKVNPYNVGWGYNLRTHVDDTYGGKVVQILGVDLTSLTIDTAAGGHGLPYVQEFMKFWRDMCIWQQNEQKLAIFSFPSKNYRLSVWADTLNISNSLDNIEHPITMVFQIQEDLAGTLKKTAMTAQLKKLAVGIGYTRNDYNYPSPASEAAFQSQLATLASQNANGGAGIPVANPVPTVNGSDASLTADQQAIAQTIISIALSIFGPTDGRKAAVIGVMTALDESGMKNIDFGDRDSIGIFQQRAPWGTNAARLDPVQTTTYFFKGGAGGQPGLQQKTGWQVEPPWVAAQAVQQSGTPDGSNYHAQYDKAVAIVNSILGSSSTG
jgi:hypothetical protein